MKRLKVLLIALVCLFNLAIARPAFADRPPLTQNPDYVAIAETLANLTQDTSNPPEGMTLAEVQSRIHDLQYQKYIMETGRDTICRNDTTQPIAIYGEKPKKSPSTYDQVLYLLPPGEETDDDWVCQGVYLPSDANVTGLNVGSAAAVKILEGTQLVLTENSETGAIALNIPPAQVFKAGDVNWEIPDLTQANLTASIPTAPLD